LRQKVASCCEKKRVSRGFCGWRSNYFGFPAYSCEFESEINCGKWGFFEFLRVL
jgi:hypothetical protein